MNRLLFIPSLLLGFLQGFSQEIARGRVIDDQSGNPVDYCNVFLLKRQEVGTATNTKGEFTFRLPEWAKPTDSIVFSSLGFQVKSYPINYFRSSDGLLDIALQPFSYQLKPVLISTPSQEAKNLVWQAIRSRTNNFNRRPHVLQAFFRATTTNMEDSTYTSLAEADISILDRGINSSLESTAIVVNEFRRSDDFRHPFFRNPHQKKISAHYQVSNAIINAYFFCFKPSKECSGFASKKWLENYNFYFFKEIHTQSDTIDVISFTPRITEGTESKITMLYSIYITRSDKGIVWYDKHWIFPHGNSFYIRQTFEKSDDGYYYPKMFLSENPVTSSMIYVYSTSTSKSDIRRVRRGKAEKRTEDIFDREYTYNDEFWEKYSIIELVPPTERLHGDLERERNLIEQFEKPQ